MSRFNSRSVEHTDMTMDILVQREEAAHGRLRAQASDGEEVIIDLPRGVVVHDGDVFGPSEKGTYYKARIEPERVLKVALQGDMKNVGNALRLGYEMGGHHLEILVEGDELYVPLNLPPEKMEELLLRTGLPVRTDIVTRTISPDASGYFAGEEDH